MEKHSVKVAGLARVPGKNEPPILMHVQIGTVRAYGQGLAVIGDHISNGAGAIGSGHYEFTLDGLKVIVTVQEASDAVA